MLKGDAGYLRGHRFPPPPFYSYCASMCVFVFLYVLFQNAGRIDSVAFDILVDYDLVLTD